LWLAAYVFSPVNTICQSLVCCFGHQFLLHKGSNAPSKDKLFFIIKRLLLVEYFKVIIHYGNKKNSGNNKYLAIFKKTHDNEVDELQPIENYKTILRGTNFVDMLFLTLPEKILLRCKGQRPIQMNDFEFLQKQKGCYDWRHLPTIDTILPKELQPLTILANPEMVNAYSTPYLEALLHESLTPKKKKKKKSASQTTQEEEIDETIPEIPPNPQNHAYGKVCQKYSVLISKVKGLEELVEDLKQKLIKGKVRKCYNEAMAKIDGELKNITTNFEMDEEEDTAVKEYLIFKSDSIEDESANTAETSAKRKREDSDGKS
jgi:hypothetical protein